MSDIGWAVRELWEGARVRRAGWNGKGMWLGLERPNPKPPLGSLRITLPFVYMSTAQGDIVPWLCSQTDLLAKDWEGAD